MSAICLKLEVRHIMVTSENPSCRLSKTDWGDQITWQTSIQWNCCITCPFSYDYQTGMSTWQCMKLVMPAITNLYLFYIISLYQDANPPCVTHENYMKLVTKITGTQQHDHDVLARNCLRAVSDHGQVLIPEQFRNAHGRYLRIWALSFLVWCPFGFSRCLNILDGVNFDKANGSQALPLNKQCVILTHSPTWYCILWFMLRRICKCWTCWLNWYTHYQSIHAIFAGLSEGRIGWHN